MTAIKMCFKSMCLTLVLAVLSSSANAASFFEEAGDWYNKITNPVSWLADVALTDNGMLFTAYIDPYYGYKNDKFYPCALMDRYQCLEYANQYYEDHFSSEEKSEAELLPYTVSMDYVTAALHKQNFDDAHNNPILNIMTFGNDESQRNLNIAYRMSLYVNQYHFFAYEGDDWVYLPSKLDAGAVLMYGISFAINTPQRIFTKLDAIWDKRAAPYEIRGFFRFVMTIDWIISSVAQLLELFFAFFGTIAGVVIAFICHPINSLCSFVGMFYFAIPVLWSAVVGCIISIFGLFS